MNLRQPYEQLIADKLRRLPAPDADASWQKMKRLLDNDEDTKAGGGKRPPGGWWRIGIVAIVLCTSLWLYVGKTTSSGLPMAKNSTTASPAGHVSTETGKSSSKKINSSPNNQKTTIDKNITPTGANAAAASKNNDNTNDGTIAVLNSGNTKTRADLKNTISATTAKDATGNVRLVSRPLVTKENNTAHNSNDKQNDFVALAGSFQKNKKIAGSGAMYGNEKSESVTGNTNISEKHSGKMHRVSEANEHTIAYLPVNQPATGDRSWLQQLDGIEIPNMIPSADPSVAIGDSIASNRTTNNLFSTETKKLVAKAQRDKALEDMSKKDKKSFHLNLSNVFKPFSLRMDADPRWAAGIALNTAIPLNAQNRYNYNMNGKSGTLTDYIPSVYLQFHLNDYVYAQTEINFISPQYTPQLLVYQQSSEVAGQPGISQQKSVYIQKLYYFNLPLSLHYSPINNLYFSAGLQFSSFQSGLVSIQEKQYVSQSGPDHPMSVSNSVVKFKDDSIAGTISPNEWRWQAGAEYYWNRFTVGLRYNRSFKNLLNAGLPGSLPPASLHNESLILSVRYNLFESRKKGSGEQKN